MQFCIGTKLLISDLTLVTPSLGDTNPFAKAARRMMGQIIDRRISIFTVVSREKATIILVGGLVLWFCRLLCCCRRIINVHKKCYLYLWLVHMILYLCVRICQAQMALAVSWRHQPDIWGLTKGMFQSLYILLLKIIPFLVQQNVGLVPAKLQHSGTYFYLRTDIDIIVWHNNGGSPMLHKKFCGKY